jgi:hypothetical protein
VITGRRAQQFHELVEDTATRGARLPEYADLLDVVGALRAVPAPVPDPAFVTALREQLVAEADSVLAVVAAESGEADERLRLRPSTPHARGRRRRLAAAVAGLALVGVSTTVAVAAQSALPGDHLYSVKRGLENAHAELTFDRAARGRVLLDSAGTRLDEAQQLSREHADAARVREALDGFTQEAIDGSDLLLSDYQATGDRSSISTLRTFTSTGMERLEVLQAEVPPQSYDSLLQAARALDQVQQATLHACPACDGPLIGSIPTVLAQASASTVDTWQVAIPRPRGHPSPSGSNDRPSLPDVEGDQLPPASVTDPDASTTGVDTSVPTAGEVQHTVRHLTDGLTEDHQSDVGSTVADTTNNLLDAVGEVGNQVAATLDDTVGGISSGLPTLVP